MTCQAQCKAVVGQKLPFELLHGIINMFLYVFVFFLAPIVVFIGGVSYAIVGQGHRKVWTPVLLVEVAMWFIATRIVLSFANGAGQTVTMPWSLTGIFLVLGLPLILWVSAWFFKRYREQAL